MTHDWASSWWREQLEEQERKAAQLKATESKETASKKQMEEELERELALVTEQFLQYSTEQELSEIKQHVRDKVEQSSEIPEGEVVYHFKWRLLSILQNGIRRYQGGA